MLDSYYLDGGALVSDPNANNIYWSGGRYSVSPYVMCVSKTLNSGLSWTRYNLTTIDGYAFALAVQPGNSNVVYAGGTPGIYKTTNQGTSWSNVSTGIADTVFDLAIDPVSPNMVYAASKAGVYKSTSGGSNWSNTGCVLANALIIDPMDHNTIYAGTDNGVYVSTNAGSTWTPMNQGLGNLSVKSLAVNPDSYLFAGTNGSSGYRWQFNVGVSEQQARPGTGLLCCPAVVSERLNVQYKLLNPGCVKLAIYDIQGRLLKCLDQGLKSAGDHCSCWVIKDEQKRIPAGVIFVVLSIDGCISTKKVMLIE